MKSNIRKLRNDRHLSQTALAKVLGKTQQTVSHMERDRDRISIESLIIMADYFEVSTDYILGHEPKSTVLPEPDGFHKEMETLKISSAGENKKILCQLILSLILFLLDDASSEALKDADTSDSGGKETSDSEDNRHLSFRESSVLIILNNETEKEVG